MIIRVSLLIVFCSLFCCISLALSQEAARASFSGQILDLLGQPISGAQVKVTSNTSTDSFDTTSDSNGRYIFEGLSRGEFVVIVSYRGFKQETKSLRLESSSRVSLDFGLEVGPLHETIPFDLRGTVVSHGNTPIPGVHVTAVNIFNHRLITKTMTNDQGQYIMPIVNPGKYVVYATKPSYRTETSIVHLPASILRESKTVNFLLEK